MTPTELEVSRPDLISIKLFFFGPTHTPPTIPPPSLSQIYLVDTNISDIILTKIKNIYTLIKLYTKIKRIIIETIYDFYVILLF